MDWTLILCIGIPSIAVTICFCEIPNFIRAKAEAKCEHSFSRVPVFDADEPENERPSYIAAFCEKCGAKRSID